MSAATGRGTNGRRSSGMLYARDATVAWPRWLADDTSTIELLARKLGVRPSGHGSIFGSPITSHAPERLRLEDDPLMKRSHNLDDLVSVTCWCEARIVAVTLREVNAGLTRPCEDSGCRPGCDRHVGLRRGRKPYRLALPPQRAVRLGTEERTTP